MPTSLEANIDYVYSWHRLESDTLAVVNQTGTDDCRLVLHTVTDTATSGTRSLSVLNLLELWLLPSRVIRPGVVRSLDFAGM